MAREFGSLAGRRHLVVVRLLAFFVLFQSNPQHEDMMAFFANEGEFVSELASLLEVGPEVPDHIKTLALRALAIQLIDRSRHTAVINAISVGGQSGLLSVLIHSSISRLTTSENAPAADRLAFIPLASSSFSIL